MLNGHTGTLKVLLVLTLLLKVGAMFTLPLTGDEAYFIQWGQNPRLGYYDHPPAVGWLLFGLSFVSDNLYWYRSFALCSSMILAWLIFHWLKQENLSHEKASWVAIAFWLSPVSMFFIVTTNDTVLVLTTFVGVYLFSRMIKAPTITNALSAGLLLALGFLSKYFAAFVIVGLALYVFKHWRSLSKPHLLLMTVVALLGPIENLYFNYTSCWNNILFNFFSRTEQSGFDIANPLTLLSFLLLLITPWALYGFFSTDRLKNEPALGIASYASLPLLLIFSVVSLKNEVGLHWLLLPCSFLYLYFSSIDLKKLRTIAKLNSLVSSVFFIVIIGAFTLFEHPIAQRSHNVAAYLSPESVCDQLPEGVVFTTGYSSQSVMAHYCQKNDWHVFASTSKFGREDDKQISFSNLDSQDLTILLLKKRDLEKIRPFFGSTTLQELKPIFDVTYHVATGYDFDYAQYYEKIIQPVRTHFYTPPNWLSQIFSGAQCNMPQ